VAHQDDGQSRTPVEPGGAHAHVLDDGARHGCAVDSYRGHLRAYLKTTVRWPINTSRRSTCQVTALASTAHSISRPMVTRSAGVWAWVTRSTPCSMIGPSSRSVVTKWAVAPMIFTPL